MASVSTGYHQLANGYWIKDSDNTGPYVHAPAGTFTIATGGSTGGGGAESLDFSSATNSQYLALVSVGGM